MIFETVRWTYVIHVYQHCGMVVTFSWSRSDEREALVR